MRSIYKIVWTENALEELRQTIAYLELNFSEKEIRDLVQAIEQTLHLISHNPNLFQISETNKDIHRAAVARFNTMYYQVKGNSIEILSFFSNRQSPEKRKL